MIAIAKHTMPIDSITAGQYYYILNPSSKSNTTISIENESGVILRVKKKDFIITEGNYKNILTANNTYGSI